jgi:hypothetical protein
MTVFFGRTVRRRHKEVVRLTGKGTLVDKLKKWIRKPPFCSKREKENTHTLCPTFVATLSERRIGNGKTDGKKKK